jgi:hypothetical protein
MHERWKIGPEQVHGDRMPAERQLTNLSGKTRMLPMAEVWLSPEAQRQLDRLPRTIRARVRGIVE